MNGMTNKQRECILKMLSMILDGCKDLEEAKAKLKELMEDQKSQLNNWQRGKEKGARQNRWYAYVMHQ